MTAANTKHAKFSAHARAEKHHVRTFTSRNRLVCAATLLWPYLPPDMAARLAKGPDELFAPVHPSNLPYPTPQDAMACNVETRRKTAATPASARRRKPAPQPTGRAAERLAVRAEAAAQAPWREAIAQAVSPSAPSARPAPPGAKSKPNILPLPLRAWAAKSGPRAGVRGPAAPAPPTLPPETSPPPPPPRRRLPLGTT
jgi:hypothetical protein